MPRRRPSASPVLLAVLILCAVPLIMEARPAEKGRSAPAAGDRALTVDDLKGLSFRSIGPANMGGRVAALAYVPGSRTSFYVGYGIGGVFKTENLGVTFSPVFDGQPNLSIGAIAVADAPESWPGWAEEEKADQTKSGAAATTGGAAPKAGGTEKSRAERGKGKIVWVGTGEGNGRNSSSWGNGVYRSTDAGGTWTHVGLAETRDIPRLAVDPRNPDVLYVAALGRLWGPNPERGVYKTADGGATWKQVLKVDANTGASDVVVDPQRPDTVYAGMYSRRRTPWSFSGVSDTGGIFRSDDGGQTWKKKTRGLPPRTGRIGLAVFPKNPGIVYAVVESDFGGGGRSPFDNYSISGGLFRSEDRGESWTRTSPINFRPFYFSRLAVDPENDQRVYLPGWDLAISDDGGKTFRRSGSQKVHVDFHAIVVNPLDPSQIVVGNDGGVYVSHDKAETWDYLNNVAAGQFYRVAVDGSDPYRVAGGLQDNGSWMGPSETLYQSEAFDPGDDPRADGILNDDWRPIFFGDGFTVQFDPTDPNLVYATSQGGNLARIRLDTNVLTLLAPSPKEGEERLRFNWNAPFFVSPHDPSVLYLGGNRVFKLTDRGDRYFPTSPDLSRNDPARTATVGSDAETHGTVVSLAESPLAKGLIWAGTDDGRIQLTRNDGQSWTDVTPKEVGGLYVSRIAPSRHSPETAYVTVDGHRSDVDRTIVLLTDDAGRTWKSIVGDLPPNEPAEVVIEALLNRQTLYVGTEFGLYVTVDRGQHWVRMNGKSLPSVPVDDLVIHPRERDLVVATHGRSLYIMDDITPIAQLTQEVRNRPLAVFPPLPARPRLYGSRGYGGGAAIFRSSNPPMGASVTYWLRDGNPDGVKIAVADPGGAVIREISAPGRPGLNRAIWDLQADVKHRIPTVDAQQMGQTQFVPEGEYKLTLTLPAASPGGRPDKAETTVKVLKAPNAK